MKWLKKVFVKLKRAAVLAFSLLQPVSVWIAQRGDNRLFEGEGANPLITPAGYAFSIWSVIVLGTIAYAIYQLLPATYSRVVYDKIALRSMVVFAGFAFWIWCASNEWLWGTVAVFAGMGIVLRSIFLEIEGSVLNSVERVIVSGSFAMYYGWTTVAVFANLASALAYYGWPVTGAAGTVWQASILAAALLTSLLLLKETGYQKVYYATILWAFSAIVVGLVLVGKEALPLTILSFAATGYILSRGWFPEKNYKNNWRPEIIMT